MPSTPVSQYNTSTPRPALSTNTSASSSSSAGSRASSSSNSPKSAPNSPTMSTHHHFINPIASLKHVGRSLAVENIIHHRSRTPIPPVKSTNASEPAPSSAVPSSWHPKSRRTPSDPIGLAVTSETHRRSQILQKNKQASSVSHCGRHGNEWLFNNISISKTVRHLVRGEDDQN